MVSLSYRVATMDDAPRLRALTEHAFRTNDSRPGWTGDAEMASHFSISLEEMQQGLSTPGLVFLVATDDAGAVVASVTAAKKGEDTARIGSLIVRDEHQRGGVGGRVLARAEDFCRRTWGVERLSLNALSSRTALLAWYERRGYRATGETSPFPRDAFAMCAVPDDLCFIEMIKDGASAPR